jgi:beta-glucosidase-like glycosyl hydrolase
MLRKTGALHALVTLVLLSGVNAQDQRPTTLATASDSPSTFAASTSTSSIPPPPTTTSIPPAFPTAISASYTPYPIASSIPNALPEVVYPVTPLEPLPVSDALDGPWLLPDFSSAWDKAWARAQEAVATLSLEQKVNFTTGTGWQIGPCVGNIPPIGDVLPHGLCLQDSPLGVRFADGVSAFPTGINAAATWDRRLLRARGVALGEEFKGKGVHIALGPMMNLGRVAAGGRNWEGFGADPYLAGEAAYETILGMQSTGVQACAKHYINNEQEHARTMSSSDVDDRTQHEVYAHPFLRSVQAGVASVMCSYNLINGTYACENDKMLNDVLKREYGFRGYVQSDWAATHSTLSIVEGLDMTMPGDITFNSRDSYFGGNLTAYVQNGTIPEGRVDDAAVRILAAYYFLKQDEGYPLTNFDSWDLLDETKNNHTNVQADHWKIIREIGAASTVLLKNDKNVLPLKSPRSIAIIGVHASNPFRSGL